MREATTLTAAGFDLEHLEDLSDSFLMFTVSIALFLNRFLLKSTD
jgi:hypothetical protein